MEYYTVYGEQAYANDENLRSMSQQAILCQPKYDMTKINFHPEIEPPELRRTHTRAIIITRVKWLGTKDI